jgi:SAM-dependent methyltransferase
MSTLEGDGLLELSRGATSSNPVAAETQVDANFSWSEYFHGRHDDVHSGLARRLDYSNDRVRFQTYGAVMEVAGPLTGARCLDAGCGFGDLSKILHAAGARVDAFDLVDSTIRRLKLSHPEINWFTADVQRLALEELTGEYNVVFATEVLQYVDPAPAIEALFQLVAPGGRLVGCVPHAGCPVVTATEDRYAGRYSGLTVRGLAETLSNLRGVATFAWRGATFLKDQALFPYQLTPWRRGSRLEEADGLPNRLHFVAMRT